MFNSTASRNHVFDCGEYKHSHKYELTSVFKKEMIMSLFLKVNLFIFYKKKKIKINYFPIKALQAVLLSE